MIWVVRSMTGVLKMPRWPAGSFGRIAKFAHIGAVVPNKLARFTDHKGVPPTSASKAYSVSFMVATYRTLCEPKFGMEILGTYNGCAKIFSSTGNVNRRPNVLGPTLDGLSVVSVKFAPETFASYPRCSTGCAADCACTTIGPVSNASAINHSELEFIPAAPLNRRLPRNKDATNTRAASSSALATE